MAMAPTMNVKHSRNNEWAHRLGTIRKSMIFHPFLSSESLSVASMALDGDVRHDAIVPFWFQACQGAKSMIFHPFLSAKSLSVAIMALDGDVGLDAIVPFWFQACQSWPWPQQ